MLAQYTYIKPRHQFGKQCTFALTKNVAEENIWPDPTLMQKCILRTHCNRYAQVSTQYASHEAQTIRRVVVNTGVLHDEGGWPKEINPRDSEVVQRYRRRVEKGDNWVACVKKLLTTMEHSVLQNNAVNIHQNFFDDLIPTSMVKEYSIRVTNLYEDPQTKSRPIRHISWSPNGANRLAAAYGFQEFEEHPADVSPYCYVWDIENPNKALYTLRSTSPLLTAEFNARDPVLLVSGLATGQVCCWDIRASDKPVQTSHLYTSHRQPASQTLWIPSKSNTDFFSSSTDGMILWWDSRTLRRPTDTLVVDLENPSSADLLHAVGITALQFEHTMSSRFLAGTEDGTVLNVNRRGNSPAEKLALRFECYTGPVVAIDRNPISTKYFLTIGDWCAKVWADDTKEGFFLSTCNRNILLSGGCWSRSRCSVFYTISRDGILEAYDILAGVKAPLTSIRLCSNRLTAICSHEDGELLAVGSRNGNIYLLECSEDLTTFTKDERNALNNYLDRCSRYEKAIDSRLREIRLIHPHSSSQDLPLVRIRESKIKFKKKEGKEREKKKEKHVSVASERGESRKKSKVQRPKGKSTAKSSFPHMAEVEMNYFRMIEEESARFVPLDEADAEAAQKLLTERRTFVKQTEEPDTERDDLKRLRSMRKLKSRSRTIRVPRKSLEEMEEQFQEDADKASPMKRDVRERRTRILKKSCPKKVCRPRICCADMEERRRSRPVEKIAQPSRSTETTTERVKPFVVENKWYRRLSDYIAAIPAASRGQRRKILTMRNAPPNVLRGELEEAKKELRDWQEKAIARRLSTWAVEKKLQERTDRLLEAESLQETKHELSESEHSVKRGSVKTESKEATALPDKRAGGRRARSRSRKSRKLRLTQEDLAKQEEEKQKELWNALKRELMRYEQAHRVRHTYPRISAAFAKTSFDGEADHDEPFVERDR